MDSLSTSTEPFAPLASSVTAARVPPSCGTAAPGGNTEITGPLYTTDDDGFSTDAASPKKKKNSKGSQGKNCGYLSATSDTRGSDRGSDTSVYTVKEK